VSVRISTGISVSVRVRATARARARARARAMGSGRVRVRARVRYQGWDRNLGRRKTLWPLSMAATVAASSQHPRSAAAISICKNFVDVYQ